VYGYDGGHRCMVGLKQASSILTGRFVAAALAATWRATGEVPLSRYDADLVVPRRSRAECALLKGMALRYVMRRAGAKERYASQYQILLELVAALRERGGEGLDLIFAPLWREATDDT